MEGTVKWFNPKTHFGFIESQGKDYFVHRWDVKANSKLKKGDEVSFEVAKVPKDFRAINVRKISERSKK